MLWDRDFGATFSNVLAVVVLAATTLGEFALYARETLATPDRAPWDASLPAHIVRTGHAWPFWLSCALLALGALQSAALLRLAGSPVSGNGRALVATTFCAAVLVAVAALRAPYLTSNDVYAYIGYAKLQNFTDAYAPPNAALPGAFAVINDTWHRPLIPAAYGPLELAIYRVAIHAASTPAGALLAARCIGLSGLAALAGLLFALTRRSEFVPLVLLNPGLYQLSVVDAHNDIIAVDAVLAAMLVARRSPAAGAVVAALSGAMKVNFALIGPALAPSGLPWNARTTVFAGGAILSLLLSAAFGGAHYVHALGAVAHAYAPQRGSLGELAGSVTHAALALFGIASLLLTLAGGPAPWSFAWSLPGLAAAVYPGYLIWGLPYALRDIAGARLFLAILPLPSLTYDFAFPGSGDLTRVIFLAWMAYETVRLSRNRTPDPNA
jgi:hypothetical protein